MDRNVTQYEYTTPWGVPLKAFGRDDTSDMNTLISSIKEDEYQIQRLGSKGIAIDLGAHIGAVTLALLAKGFDVYAAEMLPENVLAFNANIGLNQYLNRSLGKTYLYACAITGKPVEEVTAYYSDPSNEAGRAHEFIGTLVKRKVTLPILRDGNALTVKTKTLTDVFKENNIERCDFMKVDIEGSEWEIFENTPKDIINRVDRYAMELDGRDGKPTSTEEMLKVLGDQFVDVSKEVFPKWCAPGSWVHGYFINKRVL